MLEKVIKTLSEYTEIPEESITGESRLMGDLNITSMELIALLAQFEEEYGIEIDERQLVDIQTVNDVAEFLSSAAE